MALRDLYNPKTSIEQKAMKFGGKLRKKFDEWTGPDPVQATPSMGSAVKTGLKQLVDVASRDSRGPALDMVKRINLGFDKTIERPLYDFGKNTPFLDKPFKRIGQELASGAANLPLTFGKAVANTAREMNRGTLLNSDRALSNLGTAAEPARRIVELLPAGKAYDVAAKVTRPAWQTARAMGKVGFGVGTVGGTVDALKESDGKSAGDFALDLAKKVGVQGGTGAVVGSALGGVLQKVVNRYRMPKINLAEAPQMPAAPMQEPMPRQEPQMPPRPSQPMAPESPLLQKARNYKSAEKFVKVKQREVVRMFDRQAPISEDLHTKLNKVYRENQSAVDVPEDLIRDLPKNINGNQAISSINSTAIGEGQYDAMEKIANILSDAGYDTAPIFGRRPEIPEQYLGDKKLPTPVRESDLLDFYMKGNKKKQLTDIYNQARSVESQIPPRLTEPMTPEAFLSDAMPPTQVPPMPRPDAPNMLQEAFDAYKQANPPATPLSHEEMAQQGAIAQIQSVEGSSDFKNLFAQWIGKRDAATTTAYLDAKSLGKVPNAVAADVIKGLESPELPISQEGRRLAGVFRQKFDELYREAQDGGLDVRYLKNYLTHIWDKPVEEVAAQYKSVSQQMGFSQTRMLPTYEDGIRMGLKPKYTNPSQILGEYIRRLEETKSNIALMNDLKARGIVVDTSVGRQQPGMVPINAPGFGQSRTVGPDGVIREGSYYAPPDVANTLNRVFSPQESALGDAMHKLGKVSSTIQDITMSGGIPGTPVNAWTFVQMTKEMLTGRIVSPMAALLRAVSSGASEKFFQANVNTIKKMQMLNIPISTTLDVSNLGDFDWARAGVGEMIGTAWTKMMNEPTFKRFMPMMQISMFNDVEKALMKSGKYTELQAAAKAGETVKRFYGIVGSDVKASSQWRTKGIEGAKSAFLFAPHHRESMINFWVNNVKALRHPLAPENRMNIRFMAGAGMLYAAYDALNVEYTGNHMWENPGSYSDKLLIPLEDGTTIGIPFLSSIATMPRFAYRTGKNLANMDFGEAGKDTLSTLGSVLVKPVGELLRNQNYFGKELYDETGTTAEKAKDIGIYLATNFMHPYMKILPQTEMGNNALKAIGLGKEKFTPSPTYQLISQGIEAPLRFYGKNAMSKAKYYDAKDAAMKTLKPQELNAFNAIPKNDTEDQQTRMTKYGLFSSYPAVYEAQRQIARDSAQNGKMDPLYKYDYEEVAPFLLYSSLPSGNFDRTTLKRLHPIINQLNQERADYFAANPIEGQENKPRLTYEESRQAMGLMAPGTGGGSGGSRGRKQTTVKGTLATIKDAPMTGMLDNLKKPPTTRVQKPATPTKRKIVLRIRPTTKR